MNGNWMEEWMKQHIYKEWQIFHAYSYQLQSGCMCSRCCSFTTTSGYPDISCSSWKTATPASSQVISGSTPCFTTKLQEFSSRYPFWMAWCSSALSLFLSSKLLWSQVQCLHRENYFVSSEVQNPASATVSWQWWDWFCCCLHSANIAAPFCKFSCFFLTSARALLDVELPDLVSRDSHNLTRGFHMSPGLDASRSVIAPLCVVLTHTDNYKVLLPGLLLVFLSSPFCICRPHTHHPSHLRMASIWN